MARWRITRHDALLMALGVLLVLLLQFEPLNDVDIYWQVRLGQMMLEQGHLITTDSFSFTHAGQPVPTLCWLAQIIYALAYDAGSWRGVQIVHVLLFAGAFVVAGATARLVADREGIKLSLFALGWASFLGLAAGMSSSMVRPQSFGAFCFAALLWVAFSSKRPIKKVLLFAPLVLLWQNTHPSVAVGVAALGALFVGGWFERRVNPGSNAPSGLAAMALLATGAQFATPMGWRLFAVSSANVRVARNWLEVSEWLPPWHPGVRSAMLGFALALAVSIVLLVRLGGRVRWSGLALFAVMTLAVLSAARFALFWSVAMVPVLAVWIERARPRALFPWPAEERVRQRWCVPLAAFGCVAAVFLPAILQGPVADQFALRDGIAHLKQSLPSGRIYNYREWGGPLILAGHPNWQVAIDGRLYLYNEQEWQAYHRAALGEMPIPELVERYRPDAFFLRPVYHDKLIQLLDRSGDWRPSYHDASCSIFVRVR